MHQLASEIAQRILARTYGPGVVANSQVLSDLTEIVRLSLEGQNRPCGADTLRAAPLRALCAFRETSPATIIA